MHIVILNGPRDTGKDTAADHLVAKHCYTKLEMKGALRSLAHQIASLTTPRPTEFCDSLEFNRVRKDTVVAPEFGGRTWPEYLIWLSEAVCKPLFGQCVFARAAVKAIQDSGSDKIVFSDGGFPVEIETIHARYPNITLVHMHREGRSFSSVRKDSRDYVAHPGGAEAYQLHNDAGLVQLKLELDYLIGRVTP